MIYRTPEDFVSENPWIQDRPRSRVVATGGAFDILHEEHVKLLQYCRTLGDCVIVLLNTDESIRAYKSIHRPIKTWETRAVLLDAMRQVDYVVGFDNEDPRIPLGVIAPDIWVKGKYDIEDIIEKECLWGRGADIVLLWFNGATGSTDLIKKAAECFMSEKNGTPVKLVVDEEEKDDTS